MAPTERAMQAIEALRQEGNAMFGKGKYGAAIEVSIRPSLSFPTAARQHTRMQTQSMQMVTADGHSMQM